MQVYFVKATYTNNVYKRTDFFSLNEYKLTAGKMLDINFKANDGLSSFITKKLVLTDDTLIRDHTHIIVPEYEKIYKIISIDYLNSEQASVIVEEDPLLSQLPTLEQTDIFLKRTNDNDLFRGVNDIADLAVKESVDVSMISPDVVSGKWALLFFQYNEDPVTNRMDIVLNFAKDPGNTRDYDILEANYNDLVTNYPEVTTDEPELVEYYQKTALAGSGVYYECVYSNDLGKTIWVIIEDTDYEKYYFFITSSLVTKINKTDVLVGCVALPFESTIYDSTFTKFYLNYQKFVGPADSAQLLDVKIISDVMFKNLSFTESYNPTTHVFSKELGFEQGAMRNTATFTDSGYGTVTDKRIFLVQRFQEVLDISLNQGTILPTKAEPFYKYDLYVYGQKIKIPYYLTSDVKIMIAMNSGVINYMVYYQDKRNVLAVGSFTHAIKYQVDQLDAFYSQNPTYKDQFFTKLAFDSIKTVTGGAIGGSVIPGLGTLGGAASGLGAAAVDAGISLINLEYQEKSLQLKPDQIFGNNSDVTLQTINVFGIYWVKTTPENIDLLEQEYGLRGFPTALYMKIKDLGYETSVFGTSKIVYGELKNVIKNQYTTNLINEKLSQGIIIVP